MVNEVPPSDQDIAKLRRSLSNVGGPSRYRGDPALKDQLEAAFTPPDGFPERALTHAFHPWPGRMHPHTARSLIAMAPEGAIADPFMGAGTVPLEALLAGRQAVGNDLNPIGHEVAWVRTRRFSKAATQALVARAKAVWKVAEGRIEAPRRVSPELARWFDTQALHEVLALSEVLREGRPEWPGSPADPLSRTLRAVLSSLLVKASRQVSDSITKVDRVAHDPTPVGRVGHWFKKRAQELAAELDEVTVAVSREVPEPLLIKGDAREVPADLPALAAVVSSPPYPGVYDYFAHHLLRCLVLGIETGSVADREIGSRRQSERIGLEVARDRYVDDLARVLRGWSRGLVPGGFVALVIGDGQVGKKVVRVMPLLTKAAAAVGLQIRGTVSQARPVFSGARDEGPADPRPAPKEEHLVWLEPTLVPEARHE